MSREAATLSLLCIFPLLLTSSLAQKTCRRLSRCNCSMSDGSGSIDLRKLTDSELQTIDTSNGVGYIYQPCLKVEHVSGCNSSTTVLCTSVVLKNRTINYTTIATSTGESFRVNINGSVTIVYNMTINRSSFVCVELVCTPPGSQLKFDIVLPTAQDNQCDLHFRLESSRVCLIPPSSSMPPSNWSPTPVANRTPSSSMPPSNWSPTPVANRTKSCSLSDCAFDLYVAIPATAVGSSLVVIILSCLVFKYKKKQLGRYTTL